MPRRSGSRRRSNLVERHDSAALERLQHRVMLSSTGILPVADLGEELRQVAHERRASQAGSLQSAGVVVEQIDRTIEITGSDEADSVQVSLDATGNLRVSIQHDNVSDDFFFATNGVAELMFHGNADTVPFPEVINHLPPEWVGLTTSQLLGLSVQPLAGSIAAPGSLIGPILVQD